MAKGRIHAERARLQKRLDGPTSNWKTPTKTMLPNPETVLSHPADCLCFLLCAWRQSCTVSDSNFESLCGVSMVRVHDQLVKKKKEEAQNSTELDLELVTLTDRNNKNTDTK